MPKIFGLDIAKLVNDSISSAGDVRPGTLSHNTGPRVRDPENLTGGIRSTVTTHDIRGFVEQKEIRRPGQVSTVFESTVSIFGDSVNPKVAPTVNDTVIMDGVTYSLVKLLELDPASALYVFLAET